MAKTTLPLAFLGAGACGPLGVGVGVAVAAATVGVAVGLGVAVGVALAHETRRRAPNATIARRLRNNPFFIAILPFALA